MSKYYHHVLIFVLPWKKTARTWSKPHYCVPNIFFPVLSRETNLSKRKYIKDELVLFPALPRNLNFVSFDVFKSQHFSTTSRPAQHQKSVLRKLDIVLHEEKNVISADKFVRGRIRVCAPDSHGGYWVSPVKMMPKLPGITHQITYYSTTKSTARMD